MRPHVQHEILYSKKIRQPVLAEQWENRKLFPRSNASGSPRDGIERSFLVMLQLTNQSHKLGDLLRDLFLGGIDILLEADSDKECEDQVVELPVTAPGPALSPGQELSKLGVDGRLCNRNA